MFTIPGEYVGTQEEYESGFGTYNEDGEIYSSNTGDLKLDKKQHSAEVRAETQIPKMQNPGTIVLGQVTKASGQIVQLDLAPFDSKKFKFVPHDKSAILHIGNIKDDYIEDVKTQYKVGDLVRAKITDVNAHTVELTTDQGNLGAIKAHCPKCRSAMKKTGRDKVKCPECGKKDTRKTTKDYGKGKLK